MAVGPKLFERSITQRKNEYKNLKKYLFVLGDLRNNFYFRQFFIKCSFVHVIIEISKHVQKVLGHLAQQSMMQ
jgi:hypothetical protein